MNGMARTPLWLGIDLGTSYYKLGLFDAQGTVRGSGRVATRYDQGSDGRVELPADRFWDLLRKGFDQALQEAGAGPGQVVGLSYSSQANTFLLLDEKDHPLTPLVVWTDSRVKSLPGPLRKMWAGKQKLEVTGAGGANWNGALCKALWFRENHPSLWARVRRMLTISDYLAYRLTGRAAADMGTASLLGMLDVRRGAWWPDVLEAAGLDQALLAEPVMPGTPVAPVRAGAPLPLQEGIPMVAGSLDHYVAALGAGIGNDVPCSASIGTVLALVATGTSFTPREGCLTGPGFAGAHAFCSLAYDSNGATLLEWYRNTYASTLDFPELDRLAAAVPPGCEGLRLRQDPCRYEGMQRFEGRSSRHGHGHFARAILEATAATMGRLCRLLRPEGPPPRVAATGGGARSRLWLELMSEATGAEFTAADCSEPATRGAALLAGAGGGV